MNNRVNERRNKRRLQLKELLILNEVINAVMSLKIQLKHSWSLQSRTLAGNALDEWSALPFYLNQRALKKFANMLERQLRHLKSL